MDAARILVVDDEEDFSQTLVKRLNRRGFRAESVLSGEEALRVLSGREFDVVLMDVMMPGMNGLELLRRVKALKPGMGVIVVTGHASVQPGGRCSSIEAETCLLKPVDFEDLLEAIAKVLAHVRPVDGSDASS